MSTESVIEGWALPPGMRVVERRRAVLADDVVVEWPDFDRVAAVRLVDTLRGAREGLLARSASEIAELLGSVGGRFLDPGDPLSVTAVDCVARESGLSEEMARHVVEGMSRDWTPERLGRLLREEFGEPSPLDGFVDEGGRRIAAFGDDFALHLASGSVPGVGTTSLIRSLLVKTPVLLKPGAGDVSLSVLFARGLEDVAPDLAAACAVAYWPGGDAEGEAIFLARADRVVVYGGVDTIRAIRAGAAPGAPVVEYGHRVGFSVVGPGPFDASELAETVAAFDQRGCVTTHQLFVLGESDRTREVAEDVAAALQRLQETRPRGRLRADEASALRQRVETAELQAVADEEGFFAGGMSAGWAVTVGRDPGLEPGPGGRTVRCVTAKSVDQIAADLSRMRLHLQTAGYGGFGDPAEVEELGLRLGRVGVTRVVPFGSVAFPPGWWLHDGSGPLGVLVRRVEVEGGQTSSSSSP